MKTIPQIREELLEIADTIDGEEISSARRIRRLVKAMYRRPAIRRAQAESRPVTPELMDYIRNFAKQNPTYSYATIGRIWGVAIGRVSEALSGKRAA